MLTHKWCPLYTIFFCCCLFSFTENQKLVQVCHTFGRILSQYVRLFHMFFLRLYLPPSGCQILTSQMDEWWHDFFFPSRSSSFSLWLAHTKTKIIWCPPLDRLTPFVKMIRFFLGTHLVDVGNVRSVLPTMAGKVGGWVSSRSVSLLEALPVAPPQLNWTQCAHFLRC